jgi:glutamyl-tRNA synthetase
MTLSTEELALRLEPFLRDAGLWRQEFSTEQRPWYLKVVELFKPRLTRLTQFAEGAAPLLGSTVTLEEAAAKKHLKPEVARPLADLATEFATLEPFTKEGTEAALRAAAERHAIKPAALIHATRVAVTGRAVSPGLFEVLELIGRTPASRRMAAAAASIPHSKE